MSGEKSQQCPNCGQPRHDGVECPYCHCIYERAERMRQRRQQKHGEPQQKDGEELGVRLAIGIKQSPIAHRGGYTIDCHACKLAGGMEKRRINRFPFFIRLIGWIIATPSAFGMAIGATVAIATSGRGFGSDTMGFFIGGVFFAISAVGGLVGWLLLMRKNAWVCSRCGYMIERA